MIRKSPIPDTVMLHVPFRIVKRGGRKEMHLPDNAAQPRRTDNSLVKALARAFRWKRMLESGEYATIANLAEREGIAPSYMTRVLRLTLLAPEIVEAILGGRHGPKIALAKVLAPFPMEWELQANHLAVVVQAAVRDLWGGHRTKSLHVSSVRDLAGEAENSAPSVRSRAPKQQYLIDHALPRD